MCEHQNAVHPTCKSCGAPMEPVPGRDYFHCEYCGAFAFPKPSEDGVVVLGERSNVACPTCSVTLQTASIAEVRVLHCKSCRGVLATQEAFSVIVKLLRARAAGEPDPLTPIDQSQLDREVACAYCGQTMNTHPYYGPGNVVVDNCAECSVIWLDYGELASIRDAPGDDRARAADPAYSFIEDLVGS